MPTSSTAGPLQARRSPRASARRAARSRGRGINTARAIRAAAASKTRARRVRYASGSPRGAPRDAAARSARRRSGVERALGKREQRAARLARREREQHFGVELRRCADCRELARCADAKAAPASRRCGVVGRCARALITAQLSRAHRPEQVGLILVRERPDHVVEIAVDDVLDLVEREIDAVIREPALREVVGADALGAIARADEAAALLGRLACDASSPRRRAAAPTAATSRARGSCAASARPGTRRRCRVGRCVMRIAESVLLTCWPPAPDARYVSTFRSALLISISPTSSGSGNTATVHGRRVDAPLRLGLRARAARDARRTRT